MKLSVEQIRSSILPVETLSPSESGKDTFVYVDIGSVDRESKKIVGASRIPTAEAPSRARQLLREGDVIVSTVRPNLNAVALVTSDLDGSIGSTGFTVLRPNPQRLDSRYLYFWLTSQGFVDDMVKKATGASYPAVSDRIVLDSFMPVPRLSEQRRIAAILDKADAIRRKRKEAIALTEELLRATFLEMFGDPVTNPKGWRIEAIEELCARDASLVDGPFGSSLKPDQYVSEGVKVVRNWNIYDGRFEDSQFKFVTLAKFQEIRRSEVVEGDVLITTKGTVGDVCVAPNLGGPAVLSASGTVRLRLPPDGSYLPEFVVAQMTSPSYKRYLHTFEAGSAQQYLNLSGIRKMRLIRPPHEKQLEFMRFIMRQRALHSNATSATEKINDLFNSLIEQAFEGRLH